MLEQSRFFAFLNHLMKEQTFFGHNTDAQGMVNGSAIMYFQPDNGDYSYISIDPPGWVFVGYGLNEKGIAVTTNAGSPSPNALMGLDPNLMLRNVMEHAAALEEAVNLFQDFLSSGKNFGTGGALIHIVDFNQSTMAKIQVRSEVIEVTYGQQSPYGVDYIGSANHFVGDFNVDPDYYYESSWKRYEKLMQLLNEIQTFDMQACWTVLSDHSQEKPNNNISRTGGFGQQWLRRYSSRTALCKRPGMGLRRTDQTIRETGYGPGARAENSP